MKSLAILVTGDPVPPVLELHGPFDRHIRATVGVAWSGDWLAIDVRRELPPSIGAIAGVIITGSPSSVTESQPWMLGVASWLRQTVAARRPVLGLCFGHQLLGAALGGEVRRHPAGPENGTVSLELQVPDELLGSPTAVEPTVNMMHDDTVGVLPDGAVVLARTAHEPHAAVRFARNAWGVQFHPEFDGAIVRGYLKYRGEQLRATGRDPEALLAAAADTPWSAEILRRFARLVAAQQTSRG